jgi:hypothetical protein
MDARQGIPGPAPHPLVSAIEAVYRAQVYEGGRLENGISLELTGAISRAACAAGLRPQLEGAVAASLCPPPEGKDRKMDVYDEIREERRHQAKRWGDQRDDTRNTPWMWCAYIARHATKWMSGGLTPIGGAATNSFRTCMVKVAAIAVAAAESVDRQRAEHGHAFYE